MPYTEEELSKEALQPKIDEIKNDPIKLFDYESDIQMFDRLIQLLFNQSQLGLVIQKIESQNTDQDIQKLYDIAYKYIPRKLNDKVSEQAVKRTSEKTIKRLIKSKDNTYYSSLKSVPEIISEKIELYPIQDYSQNILLDLIYESKFNEKVVNTIYPILDDDSKQNFNINISYSFIKNPYLLKYVDIHFDEELLITLIGTSIRLNKLDEVKNILINDKNISPKVIKNVENLFFSDYNKFDLDDDFVFDD